MGHPSTICKKKPIDWAHDPTVHISVSCQNTNSITAVLASGLVLDSSFPGGYFDAMHRCQITNSTEVIDDFYHNNYTGQYVLEQYEMKHFK